MINAVKNQVVTIFKHFRFKTSRKYVSLCMRKTTICIGENKAADQLRGNREADQRLCFRYMDST